MATQTEDHCVFQTISYNGRLDFIHYFDAAASAVSAQGVSPLVVLRGNGFELHGDTTGLEPNHAESFSVRLHEVRGSFMLRCCCWQFVISTGDDGAEHLVNFCLGMCMHACMCVCRVSGGGHSGGVKYCFCI